MNPSETLPARQLIIDTETPATEITVINDKGEVKAKAVRRLEASLPPAIYKVRYRVGDRVVDQLIELEPGDGPYQLETIPSLPILSAAPLPDIGADASSAEFVQQLIARTPHGTSKRASIFVFISTDAGSALEESPPPDRPGAGISVHTFSGETIGDLKNAETRDGCCGCSARVDPGQYILRVATPDGRPVEQTLIAPEGWQVQFYSRLVKKLVPLSRTTDPSPRFAWQLDTARSGVLLLREPVGGLPSAEQMRWTAAARQALAAGRTGVGPNKEMVNNLLQGKFENPMLGIYAGHLLAMEEKPDRVLLGEVVSNLMNLVGQHPDVLSLLIKLEDPRADTLLFENPPMLRRSWALILDKSTPDRDLRPPRSYAARIAGSLWGRGVWLAWRMPAEMKEERHAPEALPALLAQAISRKRSPAIARLSSGGMAAELTPDETLLASYLDWASKQYNVARTFTTEEDSDLSQNTRNEFTPSNIVKMTGLPYSAILDAAASLAAKLRGNPSSGIFPKASKGMRLK